jgi:subtilisin-like proprotein convertase family protein
MVGSQKQEWKQQRRKFAIAASLAVAAVCLGTILSSPAAAGLTGVLQLHETEAVRIPDGQGSARMTWTDDDWPTAGSVTVQLRVRHERTQQLDLALRAPDGDKVALSRGDTRGENLGTGPCVEGDPDATVYTGFRATSAQDLSSGSAPYADFFFPVESLAPMTGDPGPGSWQLIVKDTKEGTTGSLKCALVRIGYDSGGG